MEAQTKVLFLTSSYINLAKQLAQISNKYEVFLVTDRKLPFEIEDMENFYSYTFPYQKIFEKNKEKYFDNLTVFVEQFSPDIIITNNFTKILPKSFIEFMKFRNSNIKILNIHHANLEENNEEFKGLNADIKQFLEEEQIISTIHLIEDEKMDEGKQLFHSYPTTLKELKQKKLIRSKEEILNFRIRNVILSYHERHKILKNLKKIIDELTN